MSGVVHAIFGGGDSSSQSQSSNKAWNVLQGPLTQDVQTGSNNLNTLSDQLGQGFDAYKKNAGFDFQLNQGDRSIAAGAAANGLLNSGSTDKAMAQYETGLGSTMYNNWLDRLGNAASIGLGTGSTLVGAGANSSSSGSAQDYGKGILATLFG